MMKTPITFSMTDHYTKRDCITKDSKYDIQLAHIQGRHVEEMLSARDNNVDIEQKLYRTKLRGKQTPSKNSLCKRKELDDQHET